MIAVELKEIRKSLGKTQDEMALALNVSTRHISRWETGKYPIPDYVTERMELLQNKPDTRVDLTRVPTMRLLRELENRAKALDAVRKNADHEFHPSSQGFTGSRPRLMAVASDMTEDGD